APEGVRRALRQPGFRRGGGRYPRYDPCASCRLHREGHEAREADQERDGVPLLGDSFKALGQDLPVPTQIVLALSGYTRKYFMVAVALVVLMVFAIRWYYRQDDGSPTYNC